jgi:hypothetical protein
MARAESFSEIAYVTITQQGGTDLDFCALTETIDIDEGERPLESTSTLCGGKIVRSLSQEDTTVTMKVYPVQAGTVSGSTGYGFYDLFYESVTTATGSVIVDNASAGSRNKYRVAILWTDDSSSNTAPRQVVSPTYAAKRWTGRNGYLSKITPSFESTGQLSYDVVFTIPARQPDGTTANIQIESVDGVGTATMTALTSYTADNDGF